MLSSRVSEPHPRIESGKLVGEQAGGMAGVSGEHELKCMHDSLKHRWSVGDMRPQTARLSHSRVLEALYLT